MLDIKLLRENIQEVVEKLKTRGYEMDISKFEQLEASRKSLQVEIQHLQNTRNSQSKAIGQAKAKGKSATEMLQAVANLGEQLKAKEAELTAIQEKLTNILMYIPNIPHKTVPLGNSETENVEVRKWGDIPKFDFKPKQHDELEFDFDGIDLDAATKLSGSRFMVLKGKFAQLHRALGQFMIDLHITKHGYSEVYVPYLVKSTALYGTGQFPKFVEDQFGTKDEDLWLIPTAEVPVTNLVREQILDEKELPLKFACLSTCFRREAGSYGKDTHGIIRRHQFEKVELVQIVKPEDSYQALEELTQQAEKVLQLLKLPYRVVVLCTGDMGFSATKTYDLEVWLPGQNCYREISSCSNTEAFQARRMQSRWRNPQTKKPEAVHTLNGSGVAVGRALIAVIENFQDEQGRIHIPEVLQSYMGGVKVIG